YRTVLKGVEYQAPRIPVISTLTGRRAVGDDLRHPDYWVRQVREAVRYGDAVTAMEEQGTRTFLEIGPGAVLAALAAQAVREPDTTLAVAAVRAGQPEPESVVRALGTLHGRGVAVDWEAFFAGSGARRVPLPTYPFQRRRHWLDQLPPADGGPGRTPAPAPDTRPEPETAPAARTVTLAERLADLAGTQRRPYVLQTVTALVAAVLKHPDPAAIGPDKPFQDLGFDSLTGVELRNRLAAATGLTLPATVVFDHPNPAALTAYLLDTAAPAPAAGVRSHLDALATSVGALPDDAETRAEAVTGLRQLLAGLTGDAEAPAAPASGAAADLIASASTDEIFDFIDTQLGRAAD
ncbi:phosphopantetheine-binding protein, partial [Streptomyces diastatochromogenes]|uniref:phosphopantetheine-binding protein n=1 Tax=Streptomyces diastatochromogenes TaxID=42236 RepID=UPI001FC924CD